MKFFQKTSVAVIFTVLMIAAALFIGLSPALKSEPVPEPMAQTTAQEQTASQTPAAEQTSNTAGDETISDKYIRDDAGLFTRSGEKAIRDYNDKIYRKTGSHIAIFIHITLTDDYLSFKLCCQFFNNRSHHFARATPRSPKINNNRLAFCKNFLIVAVCNF